MNKSRLKRSIATFHVLIRRLYSDGKLRLAIVAKWPVRTEFMLQLAWTDITAFKFVKTQTGTILPLNGRC